jgi:hypothetical protein
MVRGLEPLLLLLFGLIFVTILFLQTFYLSDRIGDHICARFVVDVNNFNKS